MDGGQLARQETFASRDQLRRDFPLGQFFLLLPHIIPVLTESTKNIKECGEKNSFEIGVQVQNVKKKHMNEVVRNHLLAS